MPHWTLISVSILASPSFSTSEKLDQAQHVVDGKGKKKRKEKNKDLIFRRRKKIIKEFDSCLYLGLSVLYQ